MTTISMENVNQDANAAGPAREAFNGERCQEELRADHVFRDAIESAGMLVKISAGPIGIIAEFLDSETLKNTTEMNNEPNKPFTFEKLKREKKLIQRLAFVDENYANDRPKRNKELAKIVNETADTNDFSEVLRVYRKIDDKHKFMAIGSIVRALVDKNQSVFAFRFAISQLNSTVKSIALNSLVKASLEADNIDDAFFAFLSMPTGINSASKKNRKIKAYKMILNAMLNEEDVKSALGTIDDLRPDTILGGHAFVKALNDVSAPPVKKCKQKKVNLFLS